MTDSTAAARQEMLPGGPGVKPSPRAAVVEFAIPGEPFAWKRARVRVIGKFAQHFEAPEQRSWKGVAQWTMLAARAACGVTDPFKGPVGLCVIALFACPRGDERKRKPQPERWSMSQKDIDNIVKAVGDTGNGVLWNDDRQIVEVFARKRIAAQGQPPRVVVKVWEIEGAASLAALEE